MNCCILCEDFWEDFEKTFLRRHSVWRHWDISMLVKSNMEEKVLYVIQVKSTYLKPNFALRSRSTAKWCQCRWPRPPLTLLLEDQLSLSRSACPTLLTPPSTPRSLSRATSQPHLLRAATSWEELNSCLSTSASCQSWLWSHLFGRSLGPGHSWDTTMRLIRENVVMAID